MGLPITCVEIGVPDGITAIEHPSVTHIDTAMSNARYIVGSGEEH